MVTGEYAPHPFRLLAESLFPIELHHMDGMALQHLQVINPSKNTYLVERVPAVKVDQRPESHRDLPCQVLTQGHDEKGKKSRRLERTFRFLSSEHHSGDGEVRGVDRSFSSMRFGEKEREAVAPPRKQLQRL